MAEASPHKVELLWPVLTWLALCELLALTVTLSYLPMGGANLLVGFAIAGLKASLIGLVFMRLRRGHSLHWLAAATGPVWVFFMFLLMGVDYLTR